MAILDDVKRGIGVFYSETNKDLDVQRMIDSAIAYFGGAGWDVSTPSIIYRSYNLILQNGTIQLIHHN